MKVLILDTYYPQFLRDLYRQRPELSKASYDEQHLELIRQRFGTSDFYSRNLTALGHESRDVVLNAEPLQRAWARQAGLKRAGPLDVLRGEIDEFQPDVLYVQNVTYLDPWTLDSLRGSGRALVGQTSYPLDPYPMEIYDLLITSFPHYVERFRSLGIPAELLRIGFDPIVMDEVGELERDLELTFVGGFSQYHLDSVKLLERVAAELPLRVWGYGSDTLSETSPLRASHEGPAWGLEMYRILARSRVTLNRHGAIAAGYSNNMRLYEATGMGACLVTDTGRNLNDLFRVGGEVIAYSSGDELIAQLKGLLADPDRADSVAAAGQRRALSEHTYRHRMEELVPHLERAIEEAPTRPRRSYLPQKIGPKQRLRRLVRNSPFAPIARKAVRVLSSTRASVSEGHTVITAGSVSADLVKGWKDPSIPGKQRALVEQEISAMRSGSPPPVFSIAAEALARTGMTGAALLEVGSGVGHYSEVLRHLGDPDLTYVGLDYSSALVAEATSHYPHEPFLVGDAASLPFADSSFDIVFSPAVIMHVPDYRSAVAESFRVGSRYCIFHRTPVTAGRETLTLQKRAYGVEVVELVFSEMELLDLFTESGGEVVDSWAIDGYRLPGIQEDVRMMTYLCRLSQQA